MLGFLKAAHYCPDRRETVMRPHSSTGWEKAAQAVRSVRVFLTEQPHQAKCLGVALCLFTSLLPAAERGIWHGPKVIGEDEVSADWRLAVEARRVLFDDKGISSANIGVTVERRRATLWGTIATAQLAQRAALLVQAVPGIREVRNELVTANAGEEKEIGDWQPAQAVGTAAKKQNATPALGLLTGRPAPQRFPTNPPGQPTKGPDANRAPAATAPILPPFRPAAEKRGPNALLLKPIPVEAP